MKSTGTNRDQNKKKALLKKLSGYLITQPGFSIKVEPEPAVNLGFVVVIPSYREPGIFTTLDSLHETLPPRKSVEVLIVLNSSGSDPEAVVKQHRLDAEEIIKWNQRWNSDHFRVFPILLEDIPEKNAGVGFARKVGMDEAVSRFVRAGSVKGVICSLDADTLCDKNYFTEIERSLGAHPALGAGTVYFEHPVSGTLFPRQVYEGVVLYELHLRYFLQAMRFTGYPFAHHTVGSAFFVTPESYVKAGGMNRKKAGEDFYFLQKIIPDVTFIEVNTTRVCPSPRPSGRVPFGTGPWIEAFLAKEKDTFYTYNIKAFQDLAFFFGQVNKLARQGKDNLEQFYLALPESIRFFLGWNDFYGKIEEIKNNTASTEAFVKRFFKWFNGFRVIKFLNQSHREYYSKRDVSKESARLLKLINYPEKIPDSAVEKLWIYRRMERRL